VLYEQAIAYERGTAITASGALATDSGAKKGRSPKDKRIVEESSSVEDIWVTLGAFTNSGVQLIPK
jgi:phosphoenolpyruvate carboxykinase (ATP)